MAKVREYQFVVGAETASIPTAGTPSADADTITKGYADKNYLQGRLAVANVTALKAVGSSDRTDNMGAYVDSLNRLFFFDSASSATGDDVLVIQPSSGTGRWIADLTNPVFQTVLAKEQGSDPSTPSSGFRYLYPKSDGFYEKDSNGVIQKIGSGSGQGELNLIDNPSGASNVTDWVSSGAGISVARTTTSSDLPLAGVIDTAIKITPSSGTNYIRYRFTNAASLKNRKLKIEWEQRPLSGYSSGDLKLEIYKNSQSDYAGSYTEFNLSTDVSGTTSIPSSTGRFTTTFDADDADYYELRIVRVSGTTALNITSVVVGPGVQAQSAVITSTQSITLTPSATAFGTVTNGAYRFERVGNTMHLHGYFKAGTVTANPMFVALPSGYTVDYSSALTASNTGMIGSWYSPAASGTGFGTGNIFGAVFVDGSNTANIYFATSGATAILNKSDANNLTSNSGVVFECWIPIAEWAGSGTVNISQNEVEYVSDDGSSDVFGPYGSLVPNQTATTGGTNRSFSFQTAPNSTDMFVVEIYDGANGVWNLASSQFPYSTGNNGSSSNEYGVQGSWTSSTVYQVRFGNQGTKIDSSSSSAGTTPWSTLYSAGWRFRVRKAKGGTTVGFGLVSETSAGLLPSSHANLDNPTATRLGLKSYSHGTTYNGGNSPTITLFAGGGTLSSITHSRFILRQMQDNSWLLSGSFDAVVSSSARTTATFSIAGVTFTYDEAVSFSTDVAQNLTRGLTTSTTGRIAVEHQSATTTHYHINFSNVIIGSKPNWAY